MTLTDTYIEALIIDRYEAIKNLVENKKNTTSEKVAQQILDIQDFKTLKEGSIHNGTHIDYYDGMCQDICNIIEAYNALGISVPETLKNLSKEKFAASPEFYVLTLDNNAATLGATTPKQTMAAYLFSPYSHNYLEWGCRQPAKENVQDKLGFNVLDASSPLPVTFIFSKQTVKNLQVSDLLEDESYEIIRPSIER